MELCFWPGWKLTIYSEMISRTFLLSLKQPYWASHICLCDIVQQVSKFSLREPGAEGTPAEGEHKEEMVSKIECTSGFSENSEKIPYWEIFQSWFWVG